MKPNQGKWITLVEWEDRMVRVKVSGGIGIETFVRGGQGWQVNRVALRDEELKEIYNLIQHDDVDKPPEEGAPEKVRLIRSDDLKEVLKKRETPEEET